MGATVTPLAINLQKKFRAVVLSGASGSYIEHIMAKQMPSALAPQLEDMLGLDYCLDEFSMLSSLFEWAEEPGDPVVYEPAVFGEDAPKDRAPDVLMIQGIGDHYIPSPVANVNTLGMRLDLLGQELDFDRPPKCPKDPDGGDVPKCGGKTDRYPITPLGTREPNGPKPLIAYADAKVIASYPVGGVTLNVDNKSDTRGMVQYYRDAACLQDGHEVAYEIAKARWQYRCFLASFAAGKAATDHARVWPAPDLSQDQTLEIDTPCPPTP
jgi:hypothetical protein